MLVSRLCLRYLAMKLPSLAAARYLHFPILSAWAVYYVETRLRASFTYVIMEPVA
jgi:hypothetical protein